MLSFFLGVIKHRNWSTNQRYVPKVDQPAHSETPMPKTRNSSQARLPKRPSVVCRLFGVHAEEQLILSPSARRQVFRV